LKEKLQNGDDSIVKKNLYFGASLRGTTQYWAQRARELRALIQFQINEKRDYQLSLQLGAVLSIISNH
jgi:hypothetical protein